MLRAAFIVANRKMVYIPGWMLEEEGSEETPKQEIEGPLK